MAAGLEQGRREGGDSHSIHPCIKPADTINILGTDILKLMRLRLRVFVAWQEVIEDVSEETSKI